MTAPSDGEQAADESERHDRLVRAFAEVVNIHSEEGRSDTPDYLLGEYLVGCLNAYEATVRARDAWWGVDMEQPHDASGGASDG